jgi:CRP-like cAMP-binding protein
MPFLSTISRGYLIESMTELHVWQPETIIYEREVQNFLYVLVRGRATVSQQFQEPIIDLQ